MPNTTFRFEPGLNEELSATSLRGTQTLDWFGNPRVEGVFALWYAKGIGVDRAHEALKMAKYGGHLQTWRRAGDGGRRTTRPNPSATAHQSEQNLIAAIMPVIYPATTDELLTYGQLAWAMSRHSGLYAGFKTITDTLDLSSTVTLPDASFPIVMPDRPGGADLHVRQGMSALVMEELTVDLRLPQSQVFARANGMDRITMEASARNLTIVSAGKAWLDVCQAPVRSGIGCAKVPRSGHSRGQIRIDLAD